MESYSFFGEPGLEQPLVERGIRRLFIGGLATDYCVKCTALDAARRGLETFVLADAIRGVDAQPGDSARAVEEMKAAGVKLITLEEVAEEAAYRPRSPLSSPPRAANRERRVVRLSISSFFRLRATALDRPAQELYSLGSLHPHMRGRRHAGILEGHRDPEVCL